ncbi:hypothetical protein ACTWJ8_32850 [Streptomyces sp. SDT5-1]|uniref:hypothetical protein n=1 Tax=Streptomyces sp. SDT5-1 TaxID=3406418 RepID=UPI003FD311A7
MGAEELMEVTHDAGRARSLRRALDSLRAGPDPKLREMASAVLRGELTAQQAFTDREYTSALFAGAAEVRRAGERRSASDVDEAGARFAAWQRGRDAEDERERAEQEAARRNPGPRLLPKHRANPGA